MGGGGSLRLISFMSLQSHHISCKAKGELGSGGWVWYPQFRGRRGIPFEGFSARKLQSGIKMLLRVFILAPVRRKHNIKFIRASGVQRK